MASTYSNLKIQLMTTGENNTTWGNVTNVNLGTALEEAIAGSADVAFSSANVTLTLTDTNATQTARNMRLNLTGTATAGFNLIVPAIEKTYIVNNATDGTITVKNATGTGIAVPTGKTMWVYNNATNVVDVTTYLTSLTLGTFLPITSGGTGGNTAANARTALGATTVGGNVFTLTNPSAITFPRFNADNTVSALDAATFRTAIGAGTGNGSVTSVGGTGTVSGLTLTGTVTTTGSLTLGGTLAVTASNFASQTANTFLSAPNGAAGVPTFRAIVAADIPTLNQNTTGTASNVTGTVAVANGGTGTTSITSGFLVKGNGTSALSASVIQDNGTSIGIGAAPVGAKLDVSGLIRSRTSSATIDVNHDGTNGSLASSSTLLVYANGANSILMHTNGVERFRITSTGGITSSDLADAVGYKGLPQNAQTSAYTLALTDMGKHISITTGGVVVPANSSIAFPIGSAISVYNDSASNQTISITTDTMYLAGTATTGSRTLAQRGIATILKVAATTWVISGGGLS